MSSPESTPTHVHPNTIARQPSPASTTADAEPAAVADAAPPSWDEDVTRPGDPRDLAALASATIASVVRPLPSPPGAPLPVETDHTLAVRVPPRDRRRAMIAVAAVSALGGFVAGYLVRGGGSSEAASMRAPAERIAPIVGAPAIVPAIAPPAAPHPAAAAPVRCHARFTGAPDGADVRWGDVALGVTPFAGDLDVPCGGATVVLTHPRYERLERAVTASADAPAIVDAGMTRPLAQLDLRSVPPGATFTIDGAAVDPGAGPAKVRAYTQVTIVAELRGYATSTERVYVRGVHDSVVVQLAARRRK